MATTYAIPDGRTVMAATTYTGNSSTQSIANAVNGVGFQPDFVWYKDRSNARDHGLFDSVRGVTNYLASDLTNAEQTVSGVTAFNSNGFTLGGAVNSNNSGETYVGWQWKAGGTSSSNTNGSITSTVSVNATAGFSVVTYTGTGANATVGHGLGVAPSMIIVKTRSGVNDWAVYHISIGATKFLLLNTTAAAGTTSAVWNNTAPTSSVFSIATDFSINQSTATYVAYCFAAVAGYSAFGSYTGNGSTDGTFVYTGFRPRWIMFKRTDSAFDWSIYDTSRDTYNVMPDILYPNLSSAESNTYALDCLSNGFKIRGVGQNINTSGGTYIYACFAETPFKYANAR